MSAAVADPGITAVHPIPYQLTGTYVFADDVAYSPDGPFIAIEATGSLTNAALVYSAIVAWNVGDLN